MLRYVVENALNGNADMLKERSIGAEVFGRDLSYDTNNDPVVRIAAGEVRKKLAQYYYDPENSSNVRIQLITGSYTPVFSLPGTNQSSAPATAGEVEEKSKTDLAAQDSLLPSSPPRRMIWWLAAGLIFAVTCGILYWQFRPKSQDAFHTFWAPVSKSSNPVLICIGGMPWTSFQTTAEAAHSLPVPTAEMNTNDLRNINLLTPVQDSITLVNLALLLQADHKAFSVRGHKSTSFEDLQKGPVILLGAFSNTWTIRLMQSMRFHFVQDTISSRRYIIDQQKPGVVIGADEENKNESREDYLIIARTFDPHTHQPTIFIAGVTPVATHAAGEFLTNPVYLNDFDKKAPQNWQTKNMELLLVTSNVNNDSGPPRVVDSYFW